MEPAPTAVEAWALRAKRSVKGCMMCHFTAFLFLNIGVYFTLVRMWPIYGLETHCNHPPLPGNQSGVKVLVAAHAKMGTRTMARSLHDVGLKHSYHSEELNLHVWSQVAQEFWRRPENSGVRIPLGLPYVGRNDSDLRVLRGTGPRELAAALSRCRADAIAFDGVEELFWPAYEASPGAKVVVLNWRTYEEVLESQRGYNPWFTNFMYVNVYLGSAMEVLPWSLLLHAVDPLLGWPVRSLQRSGGPPLNQEQGPLVMLWYRIIAPYRVGHHWFQGLGNKENPSYFGFMADRKAQADFFERVAREVPAERRLNFDPRKQGFEELCAFLGIRDCPRRGATPRARSVYAHERDFAWSYSVCVIIFLTVHWINWKVIGCVRWGILALARKPKSE